MVEYYCPRCGKPVRKRPRDLLVNYEKNNGEEYDLFLCGNCFRSLKYGWRVSSRNSTKEPIDFAGSLEDLRNSDFPGTQKIKFHCTNCGEKQIMKLWNLKERQDAANPPDQLFCSNCARSHAANNKRKAVINVEWDKSFDELINYVDNNFNSRDNVSLIKLTCESCGKKFNKTPKTISNKIFRENPDHKILCGSCVTVSFKNKEKEAQKKCNEYFENKRKEKLEKIKASKKPYNVVPQKDRIPLSDDPIKWEGTLEDLIKEPYCGNQNIIFKCHICGNYHTRTYYSLRSYYNRNKSILNNINNEGLMCPSCSAKRFSLIRAGEHVLNKESRFGKHKPLFDKYSYKGELLPHKFLCPDCNKEFESYIMNGNPPKCPICEKSEIESGRSSYEEEINDFLKNLYIDFETNNRSILDGMELDVYIPNHKLAIEFDGIYWHSENILTSHRYLKNKNLNSTNYHLYKTQECEKKGIRLIHIFENEWVYKKDKVKSLIKSALGIYDISIGARQCEIKEISSKEAEIFLNENHLQGYSKSSVRLALYYNKEMVECITFTKPRFEKNKYDWEISRFATKSGYRVYGGFTKLLNYFRKTYSGSIVTYSDRSKFTGSVYRGNGFVELLPTSPGYFYVKRNVVLSRYQCMKKNLKNMFEDFDPNKTESEIMGDHGFLKIYDCGNWKFELI